DAGEAACDVVINVVTAVSDCAAAVAPRSAVGEDAVGHGRRTAVVEDGAVEDGAAGGGGGAGGGAVAREGTVGHGHGADAEDGAARASDAGGAVAGEGAIGHAQGADVVDGAADTGEVGGEGAVGDGQRAAVANGAAVAKAVIGAVEAVGD